MDLRTFLRPDPIEVQPAPGIGEPAPVSELFRKQPRVIAFLRHVGCPFAEATLRSLSELSRTHPGIDFVAVSHAGARPTEEWCTLLGGAGRVRIIVDEKRTLYATWGLGLTTLGHFLGGRSLASVLQLARQGIHNRHPSGTRWQSAGTFAIDRNGIVRWRHLPEHAGDLPDLTRAVEMLLIIEKEESRS